MWLIADDHGCFNAGRKTLRPDCFPIETSEGTVRGPQVEAWLTWIERTGALGLYEVDGHRYGVLVNWRKHQRVRDSKPKHPLPPDGVFEAAKGREESLTTYLRQPAATCREWRRFAASGGNLRPSRSRSRSRKRSRNPEAVAVSEAVSEAVAVAGPNVAEPAATPPRTEIARLTDLFRALPGVKATPGDGGTIAGLVRRYGVVVVETKLREADVEIGAAENPRQYLAGACRRYRPPVTVQGRAEEIGVRLDRMRAEGRLP